ncbi:MAG: U32 family peptidase [Deferribacteraceae bacterium]|jgi:putative protease|nr:U32 family peptidase [Deferribacteraceae bacterium]
MELLSPAGNFSKLKTALLYGADAVYFGGDFSLRAKAGNFTPAELEKALRYLHERGKKGYLTLNIFPSEPELKNIATYLKEIAPLGADGVIVADMGVFAIVKKELPDCPVFISTQANVTNSGAARLWSELGAKRVILARETSRTALREIIKKSPCEIEVFVHGAICISYSGRCLMSAYLAGRAANSGECAQSCRWKYIAELTRPDEFLKIDEDERGTYLYNAKDLCLIKRIGELSEMGAASVKIEGRMKSELYTAVTAAVYRQAVDSALTRFAYNPEWEEKLKSISNRDYTEGFYADTPDSAAMNHNTSSYIRKTELVGVIEKQTSAGAEITCRARIDSGDRISVLTLAGDDIGITAEIVYGNKNPAYAQNGEYVEIAMHGVPVTEGMIIRREARSK